MERLAENIDSVAKSMLVALALASLVWALIALFYPVKMSFLSGVLEGGRIYQTSFKTYGYNSLKALLLVLVGMVNGVSSMQLFRGKYRPLRALLWGCFSLALMVSIPVVGDTVIVSWLPTIPAEVQHAIGSPYARLTEVPILNTPLLVGIGFAGAYILLIVAYYTWTLGRGSISRASRGRSQG